MSSTTQAPTPVIATSIKDSQLWRAFTRSVRFNLQAELIIHVIRVLGLIFLARVLDPRDFGLLRILIIVAAVAALASTAGLTEAVIQREELLATHESTAWWITIVAAALTSTLLYLTASAIAAVMAMPDLAPMIRLLCIPVFIESSASISNARLQRELRYGALATADVLAEIAFLVVAIVLFHYGYPRWSLAGGMSARSLIRGVTIWIVAGILPTEAPRLQAARELWRFAVGVSGGQFLIILSQNADYVMVGRLIGTRALGFYGMAWDLLRFIPERLYRIVGRVTLPAFSRLQDRNAELSEHYTALISMVARLLIPAMTLIAMLAPELINSVYGHQWIPVAAPLRLLTIGLVLVGLRLAIGSIYYAKSRPAIDIAIHGLRLVLIVLSIALLSPYGLLAVCAGMSAVESVVSIVGQWMVCRLIGLREATIAAATVPGLKTALWCGGAALAIRAAVLPLALRGPLTLLALISLPAAAFVWRERSALNSLVRGDAFVTETEQALGA